MFSIYKLTSYAKVSTKPKTYLVVMLWLNFLWLYVIKKFGMYARPRYEWVRFPLLLSYFIYIRYFSFIRFESIFPAQIIVFLFFFFLAQIIVWSYYHEFRCSLPYLTCVEQARYGFDFYVFAKLLFPICITISNAEQVWMIISYLILQLC